MDRDAETADRRPPGGDGDAPADDAEGADAPADDAVVGGGEADDGSRQPIDRRRLLALTGAAAVGGLAGCGGGGGDGTTAPPTGTESVDPTSDPTTDPTATTPAPSSSTASPTTDSATTVESTTEESTTARPTTSVPYQGELVTSASAEIGPTQGFASADWLAETDPEIVRVTTLDAAGEGSLRAALEMEGHRIVVFEVGGVIDLAGDGGLTVEPGNGRCFVAGQTAPSPGMTIVRGNLVVDGDDVVLQHLRVRSGTEVAEVGDALSVGTEGSNVIFDHCTATWGTDETMSTGGSTANHDVTFSNNLVAEALYHHPLVDGYRGKATLVMDHAKRVSILGNMYAFSPGRHPVLKGDTTSVVANNFVHNWEAAITMAGTEEYTAVATVEGNHYAFGPGKRLIEESSPTPPRAYAADNINEPDGPLADDKVVLLDERPVWPDTDLELMDSSDVREHGIAQAGARPADRSDHDRRVVNNVRFREEYFVDEESQVGGYPELESTERALDPPAAGEGLAGWLRQHTRAVELGESPP